MIMKHNDIFTHTLRENNMKNNNTNPFQDIFYIELNEAAMKAIEMF